MRKDRFAIAAVLALSLGAANAWAFNCYEVIDKDQNVTYRATNPPFGMEGDDWKKGQDNPRAKNLHLRWQEARDCTPQVLGVRKAEATTKAGEMVFDPDVILRSTPEYMTASGRPTSVNPGR